MTQEEISYLEVLESQGIISSSEKNLRSKIDSIIRSLENLSEKRARLDFEIRRQKKSLTRKREELRRVSKGNQVKVSLALENFQVLNEDQKSEDLLEFKRMDSRLLQESSRLLDT